MENKTNIIISPKTKVLQLIETWPQLEDVLIDYVPAFSKLKNPVLRKTVAKIATLQQAAAIGNVKVEDLINRLRKEVGQDLIAESEKGGYNITKPAWVTESQIQKELDAREMLAAGEHPVNQVMADLKQLPAGKIYKLKAPFLPAPLIDKAASMSVQHWINEISEAEFEVYFFKPQL
jgi:hypothetical protein